MATLAIFLDVAGDAVAVLALWFVWRVFQEVDPDAMWRNVNLALACAGLGVGLTLLRDVLETFWG